MSAEEKSRFIKEITEELEKEEKVKTRAIFNPFDGDIEDFPPGTFQNLDKLSLRWKDEYIFEYIPDPENPFAFQRATGEIIQPGRLFTDGGSIPRIYWVKKGLSPWEYIPAYLLHDWEFELHRCKKSDKEFDDVRDTLMEAIHTLMNTPLVKKRKTVFTTIYDGVDSVFAKMIWNKKSKCTLPD